MRYKIVMIFLITIALWGFVMPLKVSAEVYDSDWVGTLDKSYELAWQQIEDVVENGYRTYFFIEYTYLLDGIKKYPTYCIEYYKSGPRDNSDYSKIKLKDTNLSDKVKNGIMAILRNGYPNVNTPYGTKDVSEAYYATSAAIHVWTMYYGVDELAGDNLGWFMFKDGFSMKKEDLKKYISDYSTSSTASGWHVMGPNSNDASKRTWNAAMELLIDAVENDYEEPYINIEQNGIEYLDTNYLVYEYTITSNLCSGLKIRLNKNIEGCKVEYSKEKNNSVIAKVFIPVSLLNSGEVFNVYAVGKLDGASNIENYYYQYHNTGQHQTMVCLEYDKVSELLSSSIEIKVPGLEYKTYYDLNYSGVNYIKDSSFSNEMSYSYTGEEAFSTTGGAKLSVRPLLDGDINYLNVYFGSGGLNNCLKISTLLNGAVSDDFKNTKKEILTFSCWYISNKDTKLNLKFEGSENVYAKEIYNSDGWTKLSITITKSDTESNVLQVYTDEYAVVNFKSMQLECGNNITEYVNENAPASNPNYSVHMCGIKYGKLYGGKVPERENYVFVGWNTKKDGSGIYVNNDDIVIKGHQVLYAIWTTQDTYKIYFHYDANGGETIIKNGLSTENTLGYDVMTVTNLTEYIIQVEAERSDYDFIGWSYENNLEENVESHIVDSVYVDGNDIHLYANFRREHKIRFHYYDEKSDSEQILITEERYSYNNNAYTGVIIMPGYGDTSLVFNIPKVSGYKLMGWSINEDSENQVEYESGGTEDVIAYDDYYAIYKKTVNVKFYDNAYGGEKSNSHNGSSFLHTNLNLPVYLNYSGKIKYAEFRLPEEVCEVSEFDFYGWSDSREFDGSVCYFAEEKGSLIKTDKDLKFYALYVIGRTVQYFDYNFAINESHKEREVIAYEYMNYNGDSYNPEIIIEPPCPMEENWKFDGWSKNDINNDNKYYAEDRYLVNENVCFYANYIREISINIHSLNYKDGQVKEEVEEISVTNEMDYSGRLNVKEFTLPEIQPFEDDLGWGGIGYTNIDNKDTKVVFEQNKTYEFLKDTDLYAIYSTDIMVNYYDYSMINNTNLTRNETYEIFKTCNNVIHGVTITVNNLLADEQHDDSWWSDKKNNNSLKYYPGDKLTISNNKNFYAWHIDNRVLTCIDFNEGKLRERKYSADTLSNYEGRVIPGSVLVPVQGDHELYESTDYWSKSLSINADLWSEETINLYDDLTIYAIYRKPVNIIYDANGGFYEDGSTIITDTKYAYYNAVGNKKIPMFTPEYFPVNDGYIFNNQWNTDRNGEGDIYLNGDTFFSEEDLLLYAGWEIAYDPELSVIDRYYFVGEVIQYEDVISKIIALDTQGNSVIDNLKIMKINGRRADGLSIEEIEARIVADYPRIYSVNVRLECDGEVLNEEFAIYIVEKNNNSDKLRYISDDFIHTLSEYSKWNYGVLFGKLNYCLNKERDDAAYVYTIYKEGAE